MSTHQCTASFAFEALLKNANHVTLNLTVYWLSVDNLMYPTNHATRRITRFTRLRVTFRFSGTYLGRELEKGGKCYYLVCLLY